MNAAQLAFERVLAEPRCGSPAQVFDPISARIAEEVGFEVALLAGSSVSLQVVGGPDLVLVTLSELAEQVRRVARACSIPVLVDADHGYGNALNVMRTVQELSAAGAAALTIEDTLLPRAFGRRDGRSVIETGEAVGKLRAACHAARDAPVGIVARTDVSATGIGDGVARIREYSKEAACAVFISGVRSRADLDAVSEATHLPLVLGAVPEELQDNDYLAARRVRLYSLGHQPLRAGIQAVHDAMTMLRRGASADAPVRLASQETMDRLSRAADYRAWTKSYL